VVAILLRRSGEKILSRKVHDERAPVLAGTPWEGQHRRRREGIVCHLLVGFFSMPDRLYDNQSALVVQAVEHPVITYAEVVER
jgi:hypothetical protein